MHHSPMVSNRRNLLKTQKTNHSQNGFMSQIYHSDSVIQILDKCLVIPKYLCISCFLLSDSLKLVSSVLRFMLHSTA
uniref:Uncharacterized protein n=1 Tax=Pavo cristatus TaxID=9049 RepID=A0A8C9G1E3_PAVCR